MSERTELVKIIGTDNEEREADIIFVHGLGGDAWSTWHPEESKTDKNFWPMWLGNDFPQCGIWSVAYEVEPTRWKKGSTMPLVQRADNIIDLVELDEIGERPVIFITHSMGGLLVKQILRNANDSVNESWQRIVEETIGIVYLSTPHSGAGIASWMKYIGGILRTSVSVEELEAHNPQLLNLNDYCRDNEKINKIPIIVYCENEKTAGVIVVDQTSANPGVAGVKPIVVDENHITISKPDSPDNRIYRRVKKFIRECLSKSEPLPALWVEQILTSLHAKNNVNLNIFPKKHRDFIRDKFSKDYDFFNLIFSSDFTTIEASERERMKEFKDIWERFENALKVNYWEEIRTSADKLSELFCKSLTFRILNNSDRIGQLYGRMVDASNPAFQLNIRSSFPLIYACKTAFNEEDELNIIGLLNRFGIYVDFFVLLIVFDDYQETRQQVRESAYKNDFIVLNHDQLWDILAAKYPTKQLTKYILEQIDLVAISPYTVYGPVHAKMFFGRAKEEKTLLQNIVRNDYALIANRKTGKTSLLNRIAPRLKKMPNYQIFYCDLQQVNNYSCFYRKLALTYPELKEDIGNFSELSPLSFEELISNIKQRNTNQQIIFIFDEVDEILAYDIQEKEQLFKTFRSLSQHEKVRFIFSGTTTLVKRVSHPDSPLFNFCSPLKIGILEKKAARELVIVPMKTLGVKFENEAAIVQRILDLTAQHPNIIQYICDALIERINEKQKRTIEEQDLDMIVTSEEFYEYFESLIWGQSTALEKLIVCTMWSYPEFTESEAIEEFKRRGISSDGVKASLEILLTYSTLSKKNDKYFFTFREFAKFMEERSDIQRLTEQYQREVGGSEG